ncbi:hypothetical protein I4U23_030779 [Adineta vaga]|nr:hypothetical protein I4U23_030779 [Adineta vaga]
MINQVCFVVILALCLSYGIADGKLDTSPPEKYTITHEATFNIVIKDNAYTSDVISKGKVIIGLFGDIVPMTVLNFVTITNGMVRSNTNYTYNNVPIHRIVKDFCIQTGDFINRDGTGSASIYGANFVDENFRLSHRSAGWVSMANYGTDTNGSQWFVTLVPVVGSMVIMLFSVVFFKVWILYIKSEKSIPMLVHHYQRNLLALFMVLLKKFLNDMILH